ncbi:unnamed protein product [Ectocarpus fasciculatus]
MWPNRCKAPYAHPPLHWEYHASASYVLRTHSTSAATGGRGGRTASISSQTFRVSRASRLAWVVAVAVFTFKTVPVSPSTFFLLLISFLVGQGGEQNITSNSNGKYVQYAPCRTRTPRRFP